LSENEILDQIDEKGNVIGSAPRHVFHSNPNMIHGVIHCWIFNNKGQLLWQQRGKNLPVHPGYWSVTVGGHISSGSTPDETLVREAKEELNIEPKLIKDNYTFIKKYTQRFEKQTELIYLYYTIIDKPIEYFHILEGDVEKIEWIDVNKAFKLAKSGKKKTTIFFFDQVPMIVKKYFPSIKLDPSH